jgi:hypothetical protein
MAVTPVGINQQVYQGQQNVAPQTVQQNAPVSQPIPVGQPVANTQSVPAAQNQPVPVGQPNVYPPNVVQNDTINKFLPETNSYQNDIMMQGIDFNKLAEEMAKGNNVAVQDPNVIAQPTQQVAPQQTQQVVPQQLQVAPQTVAFTGKAEDGLTNCLVADTEKDEKSGIKLGPAIGTVAGVAAPFVCNKMRLGKFLTKDLLVKVPVIGAGGLCVGGMTEGLVASAKKLEANKTEEALASPTKMDVKV